MVPYGNDQGLIDYLAETGRTLAEGAVPSVLRHYGSLYVDQFEPDFCGAALSFDNSFPRDIYDPTPQRVINASYEAAYAYSTGVPIFGDGGSQAGTVKKETVDVLSVEYFGASEAGFWRDNMYILPLAYALLLPFLCLPQEDDGKGCVGRGAGFVV